MHLTLNGAARTASVDTRMLLVDALRDVFQLTGPKAGCLTGDCGACTVLLDAEVEKSCLHLAISAQNATIRTIEDMSEDPRLSAVQDAFWESHGFQCGYCLSGMLWCAADLLERDPDPTEAEIRRAIAGNLCRCTGYVKIVAAVKNAAGRLAELTDAAATDSAAGQRSTPPITEQT